MRDVTDSRPWPSHKLSPVGTSAIGDALSRAFIGSTGLSYTEIDQTGHSAFRYQDPGRLAAKSNRTSNRQSPRSYGRAVEEGPVSSSLGTSQDVIGNHTLDFQHTKSLGEPSKTYLIQEDICSNPRPKVFVRSVSGLIDQFMVCNRDRTQVTTPQKKARSIRFLAIFKLHTFAFMLPVVDETPTPSLNIILHCL